jgi:hypothetical protein
MNSLQLTRSSDEMMGLQVMSLICFILCLNPLSYFVHSCGIEADHREIIALFKWQNNFNIDVF